MEVVHQKHQGTMVRREHKSSSERAHVGRSVVKVPMFKKVQVVYYLSRNGNLQHPHYMEVIHPANQPLRLKDVIDRLTVLRGKGMPSLYSWSCKRGYKNGYVWNDLAENDVIYPSEGDEYIIKGSELIEDCTDKPQNLQVTSAVQFQLRSNHHHEGQESRLRPKSKYPDRKGRPEPDQMMNCRNLNDEDFQENADEEENETKNNNTAVEEFRQKKVSPSKLTVEAFSFTSPPAATSSTSLSDKANNDTIISNNNTSKRYEDGDPVGNGPLFARSSMFFSFIACGGSALFGKTWPTPSPRTSAVASAVKQPPPPSVPARNSGGSLRKRVVCKAAVKVAEDEEMIGCMSENPRFGNFQAEEKEYFSGSIVEAMVTDERQEMKEPGLKKSSSYNEARSTKAELGEAGAEEEQAKRKKEGVKGKCIPRMKSSLSSSKQNKK